MFVRSEWVKIIFYECGDFAGHEDRHFSEEVMFAGGNCEGGDIGALEGKFEPGQVIEMTDAENGREMVFS